MRVDAMRVAMLSIVIVALMFGLTVKMPSAAAESKVLIDVRVLAIAPFADGNPLTRPIAEMTGAKVGEELMGGPYQIIDPARVAEQMKRMGLTPVELISPTKTVELGRALGADAVLTGRVIQIFRDRAYRAGAGAEARIVADVRVLDVKSRLKLFEREMRFSDYSGSFDMAAKGFAVDVAARLTR